MKGAFGEGPESLDAIKGRTVGHLLERLKVLVDEGLAGWVSMSRVAIVKKERLVKPILSGSTGNQAQKVGKVLLISGLGLLLTGLRVHLAVVGGDD